MSESNTISNAQRSLWRLPFVLEKSGLRKSTLYRLIAEGKFPKPIPLVGRAVAWDSIAVQLWINERVEAPRSATW